MIYLDNSATTKPCKEAVDAITTALTEAWANPSALYSFGIDAAKAMRIARQKVAAAMGAEPDRVFFTSGGTEADNWAIFSTVKRFGKRGKHIITTNFEHHAVLHTCKHLEEMGWRVTYLKPDSEGNITVGQVVEAVEDKTVLVSIMAVNNEVCSILPIGEIAKAVRRKNPNCQIHTDCVQAYGKHPLKVGKNLDVDFLTVSGHKIYGPKGIGALYVKKGAKLKPVLFGGGQEKDVRPGTENLPGICGLGLAAELLCKEMKENEAHVREIKNSLLEGLKNMPEVCIISGENATPYILNISVPGIRSEIMLHYLEEKGIYLSSGSACAKGGPSHVLSAMGVDRRKGDSALRLSFGRYNTMEEVPVFLEALQSAIGSLKRYLSTATIFIILFAAAV